MNIRKIIREEINDFDWVNDAPITGEISSAICKTLPIGTWVRVTAWSNNKIINKLGVVIEVHDGLLGVDFGENSSNSGHNCEGHSVSTRGCWYFSYFNIKTNDLKSKGSDEVELYG